MLLYQYACACGQPVISGLPLQHAQGALLLSCELRRLNRCLRWWCLRWWCLRRCASTGVVSTGFGLRFGAAGSVGTSCLGLFLLPRGLPRRFGSGAGAACGAACSGTACGAASFAASCTSASCACSVGSI